MSNPVDTVEEVSQKKKEKKPWAEELTPPMYWVDGQPLRHRDFRFPYRGLGYELGSRVLYHIMVENEKWLSDARKLSANLIGPTDPNKPQEPLGTDEPF